MQHKGISIIELLGAVVIFGIVLSLSAVMISVITRANDQIVEKTQANSEGMLVTQYIDNQIKNLGPTHFETCSTGSSCIKFIKSYEYIINATSQTLELVTYNPVISLELSIVDQLFMLNDIAYNLKNFTLHTDSTISYVVNDFVLSYTISLVIEGRYDRYTFNYQRTLDLSTTPS